MTDQDKPYTVIVGVSATSNSPAALVWGRAQAQANRGRLIAVRVYQMPNVQPGPSGASSRNMQDPEISRADQHSQLQRDVAYVLGDNHGAELRVLHGSKRRCLLQEAEQADLLVLGAPRTASMNPLLAHGIVYAATCPVVVMPPS